MHPSFATRANLDLIDDYYRRWRENPCLAIVSAAAGPRGCFVKPPLTRMADHDATSEPVDGKSDNIRPPDHAVTPGRAHDCGT